MLDAKEKDILGAARENERDGELKSARGREEEKAAGGGEERERGREMENKRR